MKEFRVWKFIGMLIRLGIIARDEKARKMGAAINKIYKSKL